MSVRQPRRSPFPRPRRAPVLQALGQARARRNSRGTISRAARVKTSSLPTHPVRTSKTSPARATAVTGSRTPPSTPPEAIREPRSRAQPTVIC